MQLIRSIIFTICLFIISIFWSILGTVLFFIPQKIYFFIPRGWANSVVFILKYIAKINLDVKGIENIPENEPVIIASKHQSAFETIAFHYIMRYATFILKRELTWIPLFGISLIKAGSIPVKRGDKSALKYMLNGVGKALKKNKRVIIFPEGTRTKPGKTVAYKSGIYFIHKEFPNVKIIPTSLNSGEHWPKNSYKKIKGTITIKFHKPLKVKKDINRKDFMNSLQKQIENL